MPHPQSLTDSANVTSRHLYVCPRLYLRATCHFPGPPGPTPKWSPASPLAPSSLLSSQRPGGTFIVHVGSYPSFPSTHCHCSSEAPAGAQGPTRSGPAHLCCQSVLSSLCSNRTARQFDCTRLPPAAGISYLPSFCGNALLLHTTPPLPGRGLSSDLGQHHLPGSSLPRVRLGTRRECCKHC